MIGNNSSLSPLAPDTRGAFVLTMETRSLIIVIPFVISLFGVVANIVNMIVFSRLQGGDPININLLSLAVSDFFSCLTTLAFIPLTAFWYVDELTLLLRINVRQVVFMFTGIPHSIFVRISSMLTALISFERCLCVVLPLKVKMMITSRRVKLSVVVSFLLGLSVAIPNYYFNRLKWVHDPLLNMSILRQVNSEDFYQVNSWFTPIEGFFLHVIPFLTVTVSSIVMARGLKEKMAFRKSVTQNQSSSVVYKERKVAIMVIVMSAIYLICIPPNIAFFLTIAFFPSVISMERYADDMPLLWFMIMTSLDTFNSSINIVVYYRNSSHYRDVFSKICWPKNITKK